MAKLNLFGKVVEVADEVVKWIEDRDRAIVQKLTETVHGALETHFPHDPKSPDAAITNAKQAAHGHIMNKIVNAATGLLADPLPTAPQTDGLTETGESVDISPEEK